MKASAELVFKNMNLTLLFDIIESIQQATSHFIPGCGAHCPICKKARSPVTRKAGERIRYHVCSRCGLRFKSVEK